MISKFVFYYTFINEQKLDEDFNFGDLSNLDIDGEIIDYLLKWNSGKKELRINYSNIHRDKVRNLETDYPEFLLKFRGHTIEDYLSYYYFNNKFGHLRKEVLNYVNYIDISSLSEIWIPSDLIDMFFGINEKLRYHSSKFIRSEHKTKFPNSV
jgi:hypothetical protein